MSKFIVIRIKKDGTPVAKGEKMKGKECDGLLKPFEDAFGGVTERTNLPEYNQPTPTTSNKVKIGK